MSAHGITTCFGIPGVHNLGFWDADGPGRPRVIGVRHEQAAGYAADALHRTTGGLAAALLTSGPAAANVVTAFGEAYTARSPFLAIASDMNTALLHPDGRRGILHEMNDQAAMFAAFGAFARTAGSADDAIRDVNEALRVTLTPPHAPAYVGVPSNLIPAEWNGALPEPLPLKRPIVDQLAIDDLAALIARSPRVVLWLGGGVVESNTEADVRRLAHHLGAVVVTSFAARGVMAGDGHLADVPVHEPEVAALVESADLLVVLGSDMDAMNTRNWKMPLPPATAIITLGDEAARTFDWSLMVNADLRDAIPMLEAELMERGVGARDLWAPAGALRAEVFSRLRADARVASAIAFVTAIEQAWPQQSAIVSDMSICGYWTALYAHHARPRRSHYPVGWGTLGYALPAAIGPASQGISTLAVCGDGGPMFALGELATYVQESLPITLLVVDDGGYGMLRFDQQAFGHPERGVDLVTPDWVMLASSFGISGVEVGTVSALPGALREAHVANSRGEPRLIVWKQALYPPRTSSPRWFEEP